MTIVNKIENIWIVYILRSFWGFEYLNPVLVQYHSTLEKMSWANAQLDQSKTPETKLRLIQHNWEWQG